jgi:hypothetical protein
MNKQPFYHRVVLFFTATRDISREEIQETLRKKFRIKDLVKDTIEVEEADSEVGDPYDLME